jgi:hypothetical protein
MASAMLLLALLCALAYLIVANATFEGGPTLSSPPPESGDIDASPLPGADPDDPVYPTDEPLWDYAPYSVESTVPANLINSMAVEVDGYIVDNYVSDDPIDFSFGRDYTGLPGVITFRGNNFRDTPAYGTAEMSQYAFGETWNVYTGNLIAPDGEYWSGSGWVGQPLLVKWPRETKAVMNMYDWAKNNDELVEVIYATMDGKIYFMDLITGEKTRDDLNLGFTFKGAGALDPRGYPIMYLGSGYNSAKGSSRAFIISLIDGSIMYEFGQNETFAFRPWPMFDGCPLVDAETDQLIYPGENGVVYIIKLGSSFDPVAGTVSVNPTRTVKWHYNDNGGLWVGMEASPVIWRGHMILADNGGNLMCLNLNTLETVWAQDILDDSNCTPVLELENGHPYVYVSTSYHHGWRGYAGTTQPIPVWKIDAVTGEVVWRTDYQCHTADGTSGGVQGTIALGKNNLSGLVFVPVAKTPNSWAGWLVALDKETGEQVWWRESNMYAWSSPVIVYDSKGDGYVIYCTTGGTMYLFDGLTGETRSHIDLGSNIEASPAVYDNMIVVGTRENGIFGVNLT